MMFAFDKLEVWFVTGSQHLYGKKTLRRWRTIPPRLWPG